MSVFLEACVRHGIPFLSHLTETADYSSFYFSLPEEDQTAGVNYFNLPSLALRSIFRDGDSFITNNLTDIPHPWVACVENDINGILLICLDGSTVHIIYRVLDIGDIYERCHIDKIHEVFTVNMERYDYYPGHTQRIVDIRFEVFPEIRLPTGDYLAELLQRNYEFFVESILQRNDRYEEFLGNEEPRVGPKTLIENYEDQHREYLDFLGSFRPRVKSSRS